MPGPVVCPVNDFLVDTEFFCCCNAVIAVHI